jgi:hypothetical protein
MRKSRAAGDCSGALTYCSGENAMARSARAQMSRTLGGVVLAAAILSRHSALANDANVVLYNPHAAEKGETG